jgi:hypothetical protein
MLAAVPGVVDVSIDAAANTATCTVARDVDPAKLAAAVTDGYSATVK